MDKKPDVDTTELDQGGGARPTGSGTQTEEKWMEAYDVALDAFCDALAYSMEHLGETNPPIIGEYAKRLREADKQLFEAGEFIHSLMQRNIELQASPMPHTPGQWICYSDPKVRDDAATVAIVGDWIVARSGPSYDFHGSDEDDARLIALAPDLLEALQMIAGLDPETDSNEGFNEWGQADCFRMAQDIARALVRKFDGTAQKR